MMSNRKRTMIFGMITLVLFLVVNTNHAQPKLPKEVQDKYKTALKMIGENEHNAAILELTEIIGEYPSFSRAYRNLAEAYIFSGNLDRARIYFGDLIKENPRNAYAYFALARIDFAEEKFEQTIEKLKKSITFEPTFVEPYGYPSGLSEVFRRINKLEEGIEYFNGLLQVDPENACAYYGLGRSYFHLYEWQQAQKYLNGAITINPGLTIVYHSIISIFLRTGEYEQAIDYCQRLLHESQTNLDYEMLAYANLMMGTVYFYQGDYSSALEFLSVALKQCKDIGHKRRESASLNSIAAVYAMSSDFPKALKYFTEALELARQTGSKLPEAQAMNNIANVLKDQGDLKRALEFGKQTVEFTVENNIQFIEGLARSNMAEIYEKRGEYEQALAYQKRALDIAINTEDKALQGYVLRNIGGLYQHLGNDSLALRNLFEALKIGIETKDIQILWETEAALGSAYHKQGEQQMAIRHYINAIAIYDSVRSNLDIESLKNNFLEDKYQTYPSIIQLLAQQGRYEEAFIFAEKYKAKSLLEILSQGKNIFKTFLSDSLQSELQQIASKLELSHGRLSAELAKAEENQSDIFSLEQQITDLELRKATILEDLQDKHKDYYELTSAKLLNPGDIRDNFLEPGQALLEYVLGDRELSIFFMTKDTLLYKQIMQGRSQISRLLTELSPIFDRQITAETTEGIFNPQVLDFTIPPAHHLYNMLIKPFEPLMHPINELIIIPDDLLFYIPFEMLVSDTTEVETPYDFSNAEFMLEKYVISYMSSASLLEPGLQRHRLATKGLLAMGNPDFGSYAEPISQEGEAVASKDLDIVMRGTGTALLPLPSSEKEVNAIGDLFEGTSRILTGDRATEETFREEAENYAILHLATHFLSNDSQPLYSKIALAQSNNLKTDGYLQTYEVFNMNLNADLTVLSACNTGLGKLRKGEGLIGISRAFMFAGVPSLLVSLWNVDDESTSIIMRSFYEHLKAGMNKKQALCNAKLDYLKSARPNRMDPFYWAPFILIGDTSAIQLSSRSLPIFQIILAGVLFVAIFLAFFVIRKKGGYKKQSVT